MLQNLNQIYNNKLATIATSFAGSLSSDTQKGVKFKSNSAQEFKSKIDQYYQKAGQKINFLA